LSEALIPVQSAQWQDLVECVLNSLASPHSRRAYRRALEDFEDWLRGEEDRRVLKPTLLRYRRSLQDRGCAPSTVNVRLSAVRRLIMEAADAKLVASDIAVAAVRAKGVPIRGSRTGHWLSAEQVRSVLKRPDTETLMGKRDLAMLAMLFSAGLRRSELCSITLDMLQLFDARWVVANLQGKGNRLRTVPLPLWAKQMIDEWVTAAAITSGPILRRIGKSGRVGPGLSPQTVLDVLSGYADQCGFVARPHDCRRTFAALAHKGGARLEQVQRTLGHASLTTTEIYLGLALDLDDAPCDHLPFAPDR